MVFSPSLLPNQLGLAKVVPCRHDVSSFGELKLEAQWLWAAERNQSQPGQDVSASWACVGLMPSQGGAIPPQWIAHWRGFVAGKPGFPMPLSPQIEQFAVDSNGSFFYSYTKGDVFPLDAVLATATEPSLVGNRYPTPQEIAEVWIEDCRKNPNNKNLWNVKYFCLNREAGISTFQDDEIQEYLRQHPV